MTLTKESISGLYTAIVTPFKPDMTVDHDAVTMLVKRQLSAGAAGIVPIGGTGEYPNLSRQERRQIVATCVEAADGAPVMPGVLSSGYEDALDAARDFKEVGASAVMLVTPFYTTGTQDGIRAYYGRFRQELDLPLLAYEIPRRTTVAVTAETYVKLAEDGSLLGMKYSNYDLPTFIEIMREAGDKLAVLSGEEPLFATHVAHGAAGGVLASATIYPEFWIRLYETARGGDLAGAMKMQHRIAPVLDAIYRETNPGPLKQYMKMAGTDVGGVRLPLTPPTDETLRLMKAALSGFEGARAA